MRSLGPTSQTTGGGRGALGVLAVGAALALALGALLAGPSGVEVSPRRDVTAVREATTLTRSASRPKSGVRLFHGVGSDTWAAMLGAPSTAPAHPVLLSPRGRTGPHPAPLAVHRWGRERQVASDTALAHRVRNPVVPPSSMDVADRPPLVTRPLRGPPVRG